MQILVELNWILFELLERQLVHEERTQSTATDKISTVTFRYLPLLAFLNLTYIYYSQKAFHLMTFSERHKDDLP